VATAAGVLFGLDWRVGLGAVITWLVIVACLRYSSLASLIAALFAPLAAALLLGWQTAVIVGVMSALLFWRHKGNIARLAAGAEPRLGEKKPTPSDPSAASP
jgi:glycerol-3-phosphate acyltransferase PlsY